MRDTFDRRWLYLAMGELAGFVAVAYLRYETVWLDGLVGGISRLLFIGYVLVSSMGLIVACLAFGSRRPARLALTSAVALVGWLFVGVPVLWLALSALSYAGATQHLLVFTTTAWALASVLSLVIVQVAIRWVGSACGG
jgi:hypothetical protein